jgi:soluble lytic murein transglycosylase-like protein
MRNLLLKSVLHRQFLMPLGVALALVWMLAGVTEAHQEASYEVSFSGSRDILLLDGPKSTRQLVADWQPSEVLYEVERMALLERINRILARYPRYISPDDREQLAQMLVAEGQRTGIDPVFLAALIRVESAFSPEAVSRKGARGLMQVMPSTGEEVARKLGIDWNGPHQLHDLETNVRLGVFYLDFLLEYYAGNYKLALTAYNRGPFNVRRIVRRHGTLKREFTGYFHRIQSFYRGYLRALGPFPGLIPQV